LREKDHIMAEKQEGGTVISPFLIRVASYFAMFAAMLYFEWLAPYAKSEQKKSFRVIFHLSISIANSIVIYLIITQPIFSAIQFTQDRGLGMTSLLGISGGVEIISTVIAFDFWDYWMHRAFHKIHFLWCFHKAHHSNMEIDVTTAARFHIGELILSGISKCLMILFWGPSLQELITFDILLNIASQFHHSNVNIPFRLQDIFERAIVTPRMHRCHHALHVNCFNTNFSTILSLWDRLFRSYHRTLENLELEQIGVFRPRGPETMELKPFLLTPFQPQNHPFRPLESRNSLVPLLPAGHRPLSLNCYTRQLEPLPYLQ
jgi:sterol desaturase/sphingolipid hydroxylase (fatty acid hydroxylase superfamily)